MLISNQKFINFSKENQKFLYSSYYSVLILLIGAIGFIFKIERLSMALLMLIASYNFITSKDFLPNFIILVIISLTPLARYGESGYFYPLIYFVPIVILSIIFHIIVYREKVRFGRFFYPAVAVALAVTLGGLFSSTFLATFTMPAFYYVFTLGIGMVAIYLFLEAYTPHFDKNLINYFSIMMVAVGVMGIIMISTNYIKFGYLINNNFSSFMQKLQWGNNLSTTLLLSMPFAFYLSTKDKFNVFYFVIGCLQYISVLLSLSRGGVLFSTLIIPFIVIATLKYNKNDRVKFISALIIIISLLVLLLTIVYNSLGAHLINSIEVSGDEARANLYKLAFDNLLNNPIFGTGLGFKSDLYYHPQDWCIYWYHSTLFQILGSLGLLGVICYTYQYFVRFKTLFEVKSLFNIFVLLSFLGFEAYSMVNIGNFAPLPYVVMLFYMFIISDRYNEMIKKTPEIYRSELIKYRKYI